MRIFTIGLTLFSFSLMAADSEFGNWTEEFNLSDGSIVVHTPDYVEVRGAMNLRSNDFLKIGSIMTGFSVHLPPLKGQKLEEFKNCTHQGFINNRQK